MFKKKKSSCQICDSKNILVYVDLIFIRYCLFLTTKNTFSHLILMLYYHNLNILGFGDHLRPVHMVCTTNHIRFVYIRFRCTHIAINPILFLLLLSNSLFPPKHFIYTSEPIRIQ